MASESLSAPLLPTVKTPADVASPTPKGAQGAAVDEAQNLTRAIFVSLTLMMIEIVGGLLANSLAIITDAMHLLSDVGGFALSLLALRIMRQRATERYSYGYQQAGALGGLLSVLIVWLMAGALLVQATHRLFAPEPVDGKLMSLIATMGFFANVLLMAVLGHGHSHGGHGHSGGCPSGHGHAHGAEHGHGHGHNDDHGHGGHGDSGHGGHGHDDHGSVHRDHGHGEADHGDAGHGHSHSDGGHGSSGHGDGHDCSGHGGHGDVHGHSDEGHGHAEHGHAEHGHAEHGHAEHGHAEHGHGGDAGHGHGHAEDLEKGGGDCSGGGAVCSKGPNETHKDHGHSHGHDHGHDHGHGHGEDAQASLVMRAALIHVIGDMVQSIGVMLAGFLIWLEPFDVGTTSAGISNWCYADPVCTLLFSIMVIFTTIGTIRQAVMQVMLSVPDNCNPEAVKRSIMAVPHVVSIHDLHIWKIGESTILTGHIIIANSSVSMKVLEKCTILAQEKFGIGHTTFQLEVDGEFDHSIERLNLGDTSCHDMLCNVGDQCRS